MSIWQIIGCVMLYLACGAVINGVGDIDSEDDAYFGVLFFWPVVLVMLVMLIISTAIRFLVHGFKKQFDEQEDM